MTNSATTRSTHFAILFACRLVKFSINAAIMLFVLTGCERAIDRLLTTPTMVPRVVMTETSAPDDSATPESNLTTNTMSQITLSLIERIDIKNKPAGLKEPSGMVLAHNMDALWVVSDSADRIYRLSLTGELQPAETLSVPVSGLEGITVDPSGRYLFAVQEKKNELFKIEIATRQVVERRQLAQMTGYDTLAAAFENDSKNKGLEGITWNPNNNRIYLLKERDPGLVIEISADMSTIHSLKRLNIHNGFQDDTVSQEEIDYSGLFYDAKRNYFWITSDKGQRIFLYDWAADRVVQSIALGYQHNGKYREIEKAEGIVLDTDRNRLYVVSDSEARLYIFDVEG